MKILLVSTPGTGHINPLLAIGAFLIDEGHEIAFLSATTCAQPYRTHRGEILLRFPGKQIEIRETLFRR